MKPRGISSGTRWCEVLKMCNIFLNVSIGLITGVVSSFVVSVILKKYWDSQEVKKQFDLDKQNYCRYIQNIRLELLLAYKNGNGYYDYLIRVIDDPPIRDTFENLTDESKNTTHEISNYIDDIKKKISDDSYKMSENEYKRTYGMLFKYSVDALKLRRQVKKHWWCKNGKKSIKR